MNIVRVHSGDGAVLSAWQTGEGPPLLLIRTALTAQHLVPLGQELLRAGGVCLITYDRRGYNRSTPAHGPGDIRRDAEDARAVLDAMGQREVHLLGASYSAAVATELAGLVPGRIRSLIFIEAPPVFGEQAAHFRILSEGLMRRHRAEGTQAVLEDFLSGTAGPDWRADYEKRLPGITGTIERDADTYFRSDVPALLAWIPEPATLRDFVGPVLHIAGEDSGELFAGVGAGLQDVFADVATVTIPGAGHDLAFTHPAQVAVEVGKFLAGNPGA